VGIGVRRVLISLLVAGLAASLAACGDKAPLTGPTPLASLSDLTLEKGRPGNVWVVVDVEQRLSIFVVTEKPLVSCSLSQVATDDGSSMAPQSVQLQHELTGSGYGGHPRKWTTVQALTAGTYRIQVEGEGRVISLRVEKVKTE
jgi:hypothetical protein